jgi:transmembrane sensor
MANESARQIDEAAAAWAVRADRGLSAVETTELDAWLRGDIRRSGAYARMTWALMSTEKADALAVGYNLAQDRMAMSARVTRRQWIGAGAAVAASIAGAGIYLQTVRPAVYSTRKGEKKVVSLDDGSVLTLNTATRLEVDYSKARRHIRLIEGEALFDVAKDRTRPFVVSARDADVRAVGTSFTVTNIGVSSVQVLVREGIVDISRPKAPERPATRLLANNRAVVTRETGAVAVERVDNATLGADLAWKEGRIIFQGETLAAAAAKFGRYSDIGIVIPDPSLGAEEVSGAFDANDPVGFAKSMALSLDAHADISAKEVRLTR